MVNVERQRNYEEHAVNFFASLWSSDSLGNILKSKIIVLLFQCFGFLSSLPILLPRILERAGRIHSHIISKTWDTYCGYQILDFLDGTLTLCQQFCHKWNNPASNWHSNNCPVRWMAICKQNLKYPNSKPQAKGSTKIGIKVAEVELQIARCCYTHLKCQIRSM